MSSGSDGFIGRERPQTTMVRWQGRKRQALVVERSTVAISADCIVAYMFAISSPAIGRW